METYVEIANIVSFAFLALVWKSEGALNFCLKFVLCVLAVVNLIARLGGL